MKKRQKIGRIFEKREEYKALMGKSKRKRPNFRKFAKKIEIGGKSWKKHEKS